MKHVGRDDVRNEPHPMGVNTVRKSLGEALGTEDVAIVHYELEPGDSFSGGLHTHHDQEEIFLVLEGEAVFDVGKERDQVTVEAGEAIRFAPGEFQFGHNETEERVTGLAIAAPGARHNWEDIEGYSYCPECETETSHGVELLDDGELKSYCEECGLELQSG